MEKPISEGLRGLAVQRGVCDEDHSHSNVARRDADVIGADPGGNDAANPFSCIELRRLLRHKLALADFSDQTKLSGSRDFVTRLWASEAARLGYQDAKALLAMCRQSFRTYSAVQSNSDRLAGTAFGEARLSGSCGVFTHMLAFHQATNMPNGDAIIEGFVRSEATNAGHTFGSYLKACVKAHLLYDELLKAF